VNAEKSSTWDDDDAVESLFDNKELSGIFMRGFCFNEF
jgi:hypothetical protein